MPKKLVVCFDGTWNAPEDDEAGHALHASVRARLCADPEYRPQNPGIERLQGGQVHP